MNYSLTKTKYPLYLFAIFRSLWQSAKSFQRSRCEGYSGKIDLITADCVWRWGWLLSNLTRVVMTGWTTGSSVRWSNTRRARRESRVQTSEHLFTKIFYLHTYIYISHLQILLYKQRKEYILWISNDACYELAREW